MFKPVVVFFFFKELSSVLLKWTEGKGSQIHSNVVFAFQFRPCYGLNAEKHYWVSVSRRQILFHLLKSISAGGQKYRLLTTELHIRYHFTTDPSNSFPLLLFVLDLLLGFLNVTYREILIL